MKFTKFLLIHIYWSVLLFIYLGIISIYISLFRYYSSEKVTKNKWRNQCFSAIGTCIYIPSTIDNLRHFYLYVCNCITGYILSRSWYLFVEKSYVISLNRLVMIHIEFWLANNCNLMIPFLRIQTRLVNLLCFDNRPFQFYIFSL